MNSKIKGKKLKKKSEFRFHPVLIKTKSGNIHLKKHPAYIFYKSGNIRIYVPITHSKKIRGKIVIKLRQNPNPKDIRDSYYIEEICEDNNKNFSGKKKDWMIDDLDNENIRKLYDSLSKKKSPKKAIQVIPPSNFFAPSNISTASALDSQDPQSPIRIIVKSIAYINKQK